MNIPVRERRGVLSELADDFFEDVFQCDEAHDLAVFVDDESESPPIALKILKLRSQWRTFGNVVGFSLDGHFAESFAIERAAREFLRNALHMQQAHHISHVATVNG